MDKYLPILAIETSGETCSAAVLLNENNSAEISIKQKHVHSKKLLSMIDQLMSVADIKIEDLNSIAVSIGPGSFTGLRIGLAAAKGIAYGRSIPIIPVPTFDALALQISKFLPDGTNFAIANKVNISELYFEKFIVSREGYTAIEDLRLINKDSLSENLNEGELLFGSADTENKTYNMSEPSAERVAIWSYIYGKDLLTSNFDYLEPKYLKNFVAKVKK
jgi:tRNA threonylcarbamoyladenosine biosynthesis protein TsaB